jgi:hypothetical protein
MWQTGYLTISEKFDFFDEIRYKLDIPNKEVRISLMSEISSYLTEINTTEYKDKIKIALFNKDIENFKTSLVSLYASIANNSFTKNNIDRFEGYYISVFFAYIKALGVDVQCEVPINRGRIDAVINLPEVIYIIEFKVDDNGALEQIKDRKYYEKYLDTYKEIILIGIEFSTTERNVINLEAVRCEKH